MKTRDDTLFLIDLRKVNYGLVFWLFVAAVVVCLNSYTDGVADAMARRAW